MQMPAAAWERIAHAIEFYVARDFIRLDPPWLVTRYASHLTGAASPDALENDGQDLVGSAEQGFLQLLIDDKIIESDVQYVGVTPCFRTSDEGKSPLHHPYFMKVELFNPSRSDDMELLAIASQFMSRYGDVEIKKEEDTTDILVNGIEVASYCERKVEGREWTCCTGLAEPRFSEALGEPKGYHRRHIPKDKYGSAGKIVEEIMEFQDALRQGNQLMAAQELSDVIGAIFGYMNAHSITFGDMMKQAEATRRAFESGRRK